MGNFLLYLIATMLVAGIFPVLLGYQWGNFISTSIVIALLITLLQSIREKQKDIEEKLDRLLKDLPPKADF